jgi:acyl carrier protein
MEEFVGHILDYLRADLRVDVSGLDATSPLVTTGLLDSMALVRLAAFLERSYDVTIPDHEIGPEHFDSIERIRRYLAGKRS